MFFVISIFWEYFYAEVWGELKRRTKVMIQEVNQYVSLYLSSVSKASDFRCMRKVVMVFLDYLFEWDIGQFWSEQMMNLVEVRCMQEFVWWFLILFSTNWFYLLKKDCYGWGRWVLSLISASILCLGLMAVLN